jgi:hypothetical protein
VEVEAFASGAEDMRGRADRMGRAGLMRRVGKRVIDFKSRIQLLVIERLTIRA